ncbi:MAG: arginase [Thermodesulfobacteriota bacterium]|nr:arginase [Thermodesulfobacteriota bacterium]
MKNELRIIGIPIDLGQKQRGVDMGPSAVRYAGLLSRLCELGYNIRDNCNIPVLIRAAIHEPQNLMPAIRDACELAYQAAREAVAAGCKPVFLGGDHSLAIGTIGGVTHEKPCGVIWIDAHGDFNTTETSPTCNIHGMALAVLNGHGITELVNVGRPGPKLNARDVVILGVRSLDKKERVLLKQSGITVFTMRDIDEFGISAIARKALETLAGHERIHISLDMDSLDPIEAPGVGTPVGGGLTIREAHLLMEIIADTRRLASMDIVEINPILDEQNHTAKVAVDLAVSAFGKKIF